MANIMEEVYILEFKVKELKVDDDSMNKVFHLYEKKFFEENEYDSMKYKKSLEYYLGNPEHMEYIYSIIADSLILRNKLEELKN